MHKYAVITFPFIFSNFREEICITMQYYVRTSVTLGTSHAEEEIEWTLFYVVNVKQPDSED
ncbi:hypothetical protein T01_12965 [Trichinella spiralis]|uniref:Uncharacterized protein n=1 Tax=Trichinella spiralis TaxID=6334 RepID=A0A0V1BFX9_TRISP|nr:hypothetical protein T01_12965 [Trichinella spiralis]